MKRLKRGLWFIAWGVWVWLGFGLYRELPRELGPVVCKLPISRDSTVLGFVETTDRIAVVSKTMNNLATTIGVYDSRTAELLSKNYAPAVADVMPMRHVVRSHGALVAHYVPFEDDDRTADGLHLLDLTIGKWKRLSTNLVTAIAVHPRRPWIGYVDRGSASSIGKPRGSQRLPSLVVYDFERGRPIFARPFTVETRIIGPSMFLPDSATMIVRTLVKPAGGDGDYVPTLEIWNLDGAPKLERTISNTWIGEEHSIGARRLASGGWKKSAIEVFDLDVEQMVFSHPIPAEEPTRSTKRGAPRVLPREFDHPTLSASGRMLFDARSRTLWEVNSTRVCWQGKPHEHVSDIGDGEHFTVVERWDQLWNGKPSPKYWTRAVRKLETGDVLVRSMGILIVDPQLWNASRTLGVTYDARVYHLPLPVNWTLLAICQSILALPLILLLAILRWRRKRQAVPPAAS
jgi:hypothetical protein